MQPDMFVLILWLHFSQTSQQDARSIILLRAALRQSKQIGIHFGPWSCNGIWRFPIFDAISGPSPFTDIHNSSISSTSQQLSYRFSPCFLHGFPCVSQFFSQVPPKKSPHGRMTTGRATARTGSLLETANSDVAALCLQLLVELSQRHVRKPQWMAFRGSKGVVDHWNFWMIWWVYIIYIYIYIYLFIYLFIFF